MLAAFLTASGAVFLALSIAMMIVWHEPELSGLAGGMTSACILAAGIVSHINLVIALGAAGVATAFIRWGGPRKRKQVKRVLGDKSRQLRDGLVQRMRQRRVARPGWSQSPPRCSPARPWPVAKITYHDLSVTIRHHSAVGIRLRVTT
jgi:hypothetical protein